MEKIARSLLCIAVLIAIALLVFNIRCAYAAVYEVVSTDSMWDTMIEDGNLDAEDSASHCDANTLEIGKGAGVNDDIDRVLFRIDFSGCPCAASIVDSVIMQIALTPDGGRSVDRCSAEVFLLLQDSPLQACASDTTGGCGNINMHDANICTTSWNTDMADGAGSDRETSPRAYLAEDADAGFNLHFTFPITDLAKTWIDYPDSNLGAVIICSEENGNISSYQRFVWYGDDQPGAARSMQATVYYTVAAGRRRHIILSE